MGKFVEGRSLCNSLCAERFYAVMRITADRQVL